MSISYESFLTKDKLDTYEDPEKYKTYESKLQKYRQDLEDALTPEYKIELPKPIDQLIKEQFNPYKYLYDNKLLSEREFAITDQSSVSLAAKIASGEYSSVEVLKAYARRAIIAHQFTNSALQVFVDEGLKRAEYLDEYLKTHGKTIGPLHGVPVSLKEHINYKGKSTHACYVSLIDHVPEEHGVTTQILENLGAVFYIRTNQPQTLMHLDSNNNFIGLSRNPHNLSLSPGGSSSGEGSIVGFGGSSFGIGSDIGGSIRAPAAYAGIYGLRPTSKRISTNGSQSAGAGQETVLGVAGPMTRSVEDVDFFMKTYINDGAPWLLDQNCLPLPWKNVPVPEAKDLTVAIMYDDGLVKPTPPIQRGLKHVEQKLKDSGVKVVPFEPFRTQEAYDVVHKSYTCDGNTRQHELLSKSGEPLKKLTKWNLNYGDGAKQYTTVENRKLNSQRDSLRQEYTDFLVKNKIDFIISPAYNNVAPKPEEVYNWSYTSLYNVLDFPTLTFQTGLFQDPSIDKWDSEHSAYKFRSDLEKLELENYKPEDFVGAPIGLQLSGRRYFDEEVVAAGKTISKILGVDLYKH